MSFIRRYKWVIIGILGVILASLLGIVIYVSSIIRSIPQIEDLNMEEMTNPNISVEAQEVMEGYWTIALFGVDSREGDLGKGTLADVQIICNIDRKTGEIRLISVYRDTYLKVSEKGKYSKINDSYLLGGPAQAVSALSENLDMAFDDCIAFNWKAVADTINLLGGIDIEITNAEFKMINGFITETVKSTGVASTHLTHAGMNHLDGVQAVAYARLRKMDTDFKRTERQRTVIAKTLEKAKKADFAVLNNILVTVLPQIKSTITVDDLIPLAQNITKYHIGTSNGFPFELKDKMINGADCVVPITLESNVMELHRVLFDDMDYKPSKKVLEISSKIAATSRSSGKKETGNNYDVETSVRETSESVQQTKETLPSEGAIQESSAAGETNQQGPGYRPTQGTTAGTTSSPAGPGVETSTPEPGQSEPSTEETLAESKPVLPGESTVAATTAEESKESQTALPESKPDNSTAPPATEESKAEPGTAAKSAETSPPVSTSGGGPGVQP